jgi:hypothetical protein
MKDNWSFKQSISCNFTNTFRNKPVSLMELFKSFRKSGLECIMPLFEAGAFVELTGDLLDQENPVQKNLNIQRYIP